MNGVQIQRIALITDFGANLYVGQMRACLDSLLPGLTVVDLVHDLAPFRVDLAGYLLPALVRDMPPGTLYLAVVDPGVGGDRSVLAVEADGAWFLGPDNGLFGPLVGRANRVSVWQLGWQPEAMSASFHGRDLFVPAAARICLGEDVHLTPARLDRLVGMHVPLELPAVIYVDSFGNLMTGLHPPGRDRDWTLSIGQQRVPAGRTFCQMAVGEAFWYENSLGLVEIAVNQGRADRVLGLTLGDAIGPFLERM